MVKMPITGGYFGSGGDMKQDVYDTDKNDIIDFVEPHGGNVPKIASANIRNTHTISISGEGGENFVRKATFTFTYGIKGIITSGFRLYDEGSNITYIEFRKNGETPALGAEDFTNAGGAWSTQTCDLTVDLKPGDTLEAWFKVGGAEYGGFKEWKLKYDNDPVCVAAIT